MPSYLLVAHQTAESDELLAAAEELSRADPSARFLLLVPATPVEHLLVWEEGETRELARARAEAALGRLRGRGLDVIAAEIGDADPVQAIGDEVRSGRQPYQAIVLSTLPPGLSRWLHLDVISRVRRSFPRHRVIHVTANVAAKPSGR